MSLKHECNCDDCKKSIDDGDSVYCESCWNHQIEIADEEIDKLNKRIDSLQDQINHLEETK